MSKNISNVYIVDILNNWYGRFIILFNYILKVHFKDLLSFKLFILFFIVMCFLAEIIYELNQAKTQ